MSRRLVYTGKRFEFVETSETVAPVLADLPRKPQKAAYGHRGLPYRLRDLKPVSEGGNGYRPGPLLDLGPDQCRYEIRPGIMCGGKGYPWCDCHRAVCYTGKVAWTSRRAKGLGNGTHKEGWAR